MGRRIIKKGTITKVLKKKSFNSQSHSPDYWTGGFWSLVGSWSRGWSWRLGWGWVGRSEFWSLVGSWSRGWSRSWGWNWTRRIEIGWLVKRVSRGVVAWKMMAKKAAVSVGFLFAGIINSMALVFRIARNIVEHGGSWALG